MRNNDLIHAATRVGGPDEVDVYHRRREYGPGPKRTFAERLARLRWVGAGPYDLAVIDVDDRAQCGPGTTLGWIHRAHRTDAVGSWAATSLEYDGRHRFLGYHDTPMAAVVAVVRGGLRLRPDRATAPEQAPMYVVTCGPVRYELRRDGAPISLIEAMRDSYGVSQRRIWRLAPGGDMVAVVTQAGSSVEIEYVPTGRRMRRRLARHTRERITREVAQAAA